MVEALEHMDLTHQSAEAARAASERAGVRILETDSTDQLTEISAFLDGVWSARDGEPLISAHHLRALAYSGNYVCGAYGREGLRGAIAGFFGFHDGKLHLHSHVLGVAQDARSRNVGFALKQHQRAWALERGVTTVTWTFDPLVRRNAYFNLTKLGGRVGAYFADFYGPMDDGINAGDRSDRVVLEWQLDSPHAVAASTGTAVSPDVPDVGSANGHAVVLASDGGGSPSLRSADGPLLLAWIPEDIVAMRGEAPELARRWRMALRSAVGSALNDGYVATAATRSGWIVLEQER